MKKAPLASQEELSLLTKSAFVGFPFEGKLSAPRLTNEVETTALSKSKYSLSFLPPHPPPLRRRVFPAHLGFIGNLKAAPKTGRLVLKRNINQITNINYQTAKAALFPICRHPIRRYHSANFPSPCQ